jgi:hypothetical protein
MNKSTIDLLDFKKLTPAQKAKLKQVLTERKDKLQERLDDVKAALKAVEQKS